ncbi:MAG: hypothetical protein AAGA56_24470 [Myxococcota bacterium]
MARFAPCPHCARHILVVERHCHHCGGLLGGRSATSTAAAAALGLSLSVGVVACTVPIYGAPDTGRTVPDTSTSENEIDDGAGGADATPVDVVPDTSGVGGGGDDDR